MLEHLYTPPLQSRIALAYLILVSCSINPAAGAEAKKARMRHPAAGRSTTKAKTAKKAAKKKAAKKTAAKRARKLLLGQPGALFFALARFVPPRLSSPPFVF